MSRFSRREPRPTAKVRAAMGDQHVILKRKAEDEENCIFQLKQRIQELEEQLKASKKLAAQYRSEARVALSNTTLISRIQDLEQELKEYKEADQRAARMSRIEAAQLKAEAEAWEKQLQESRELLNHEAESSRKYRERYLACMAENQALVNQLKELTSAMASSSKQPSFCKVGNADLRNRDAVSRQTRKLRQFLTDIIDKQLEGGCHGQLAKDMMVSFLAYNDEIMEFVLSEMQVYERMEKQTVEAIQEMWCLEVCASMFMQADMTWAGYQAVINLMCRQYDSSSDEAVDLKLPHGSSMPRFKPKNTLLSYLKEMSDSLGICPVAEGQAALADIQTLLLSRLQHIRETTGGLPDSIRVCITVL